MSQFTLGQRQTLEKRLKETIARLRSEVAEALQAKGNAGQTGLPNHMNELDDQAVADLETALDIAGVARDLDELRESVRALQRLKTPGYGVCANCREAISFSRLEASPAALLCVDCQSRAEALLGKKRSSL